VVVAAAGNDSRYDYCSYPANYNGVIAVGATDFNDQHANFSNFGSCVDIVAPGYLILSTYPAQGCPEYGVFGSVTYDADCSTFFSGTSQAAPHVAGAAAMVKSAYPSLSRLEIEASIKGSADHSGALLGLPLDMPYSLNGRLNLDIAMDAAAALVNQPQPSEPYLLVSNIVVSSNNLRQGNKMGSVDITILDDQNIPIGNVQVLGGFSGKTNEDLNGSTGPSGIVTFTSGVIKGGGEWCFEVNGVEGEGYLYDDTKNNVTKSCESGYVF